MCTCQKPTRNNNTVGGYHYSMPEPEQGEVILFEEPGRCSPKVYGKEVNIDFHSFNFRVFKSYCRITLAVKHGGGVERFDLGTGWRWIPEILQKLDSDSRYLLLDSIMDAHKKEIATTGERVNGIWRKAFVEGRLKKRKMPGREAFKVWIDGRES